MATHRKTDPDCREYRAPHTAFGRWLFDRARGRVCWSCHNLRAGHERRPRSLFAALAAEVYR